jgi:hypothetical protein
VPITRPRGTLGSRGYRGPTTFTGREYTLLFKGGTLSTTMQTTLKNNYAFSDAAVKFYELFTRPDCKEHEI